MLPSFHLITLTLTEAAWYSLTFLMPLWCWNQVMVSGNIWTLKLNKSCYHEKFQTSYIKVTQGKAIKSLKTVLMGQAQYMLLHAPSGKKKTSSRHHQDLNANKVLHHQGKNRHYQHLMQSESHDACHGWTEGIKTINDQKLQFSLLSY